MSYGIIYAVFVFFILFLYVYYYHLFDRILILFTIQNSGNEKRRSYQAKFIEPKKHEKKFRTAFYLFKKKIIRSFCNEIENESAEL